MSRFVIHQEVRASPEHVVAWWTDYRDDDPTLDAQMTGRTVRRKDDHHIQVFSELLFGGRRVKIEGLVTLEGPTSWRFEGDLYVGGTLFGKEVTRFTVEPVPGGTRVTGDYSFLGKDRLHRFLFALSKRSARRGREEAFRDFARAIEQDREMAGLVPRP